MKELMRHVNTPLFKILIILIAVSTGGYYFFSQPSGNEKRDESNELNQRVQTGTTDQSNQSTVKQNQPVGFEENQMNIPTVDVQSGTSAQVNPNIPVVTEEHVIGASVGMKGFKFAPATVTIKAGQSVEWTNDDSANHTVTADDGSFDSGNEAPGNIYTHKFDKPGTYTYFCKWHPNMKGTVIVTE